MQFNLTNSGWTLLASQGQSVEIQNLSTAGGTRLLTASSLPAPGSTDGEVMYEINSIRRYAEPLPANLYGCSVEAASNVEVMGIGGVLFVTTGQPATAGDTVIQGQTSAAAIAAGGTGYVAGDVSKTITLTDGTVLTIGTVASGAVTAVTLTTPGTGTTSTASAVAAASTTATGTGLTANLTYTSVATTLFGGTAPVNGWKIVNPDASNDLWANDNGAPALNNGCRVLSAGGKFATEAGEKPVGVLKVWGPVVGQRVIARRW